MFLVLNGLEISASIDAQEQMVLAVVAGELGREAFASWLRNHTVPVNL